jgi:hypothetical protein
MGGAEEACERVRLPRAENSACPLRVVRWEEGSAKLPALRCAWLLASRQASEALSVSQHW